MAIELVGVSKHFAGATFVGLDDVDDVDDTVEEDDDEPVDEPALSSGATALEELTLSVPRGTVFGIAGSHGAGKTTLVRLIAGTLVPTSGEVHVRGRVAPPPETLGRLLDPEAAGAANLALLARFLGLPQRVANPDVSGVFALAGLAGSEGLPFSSIPRRELSALLVAAVVHLRPDIYLFDPAPKIADPSVREAIDELIAERVSAGAVVVLTGENGDRLTADIVAVLDRGRLVELGPRAGPGKPPPVSADPDPVPDVVPVPEVSPPLPGPRAPALLLRRVDIDLEARPATIRLLAEVPVDRVDATFGFIFRVDGLNVAKLRSASYALRAGSYEVVAYLAELSGLRGTCNLLVGARLDHAGEDLSVRWRKPIELDVGAGLDGPEHTSWRVDPIGRSDVVKRRPVASSETTKAEHEDKQRDDAG